MPKIKQKLTGTKEMFEELKKGGFSVDGLVPTGRKTVERPEGSREVELFTAEISKDIEASVPTTAAQDKPSKQVVFEGNEGMLRGYLLKGYRILYQERSPQGIKAILRKEAGGGDRNWGE